MEEKRCFICKFPEHSSKDCTCPGGGADPVSRQRKLEMPKAMENEALQAKAKAKAKAKTKAKGKTKEEKHSSW